MKAKIYSTYSESDASFRQRVKPLEHLLLVAGWEVTTKSIFTDTLFQFRNKNVFFRTLVGLVILVRLIIRLLDIIFGEHVYLVVVHRESFPFFTPLTEKILRKKSAIFWFDFDDAIYTDRKISDDWRSPFQKPANFATVVSIANYVTTASPSLLDWSRGLNNSAFMIPTIPPERSKIVVAVKSSPVAIIWIGSDSTSKHLEFFASEIADFASKTNVKVLVLGGDKMLKKKWPEEFSVKHWSPEREEALLSLNAVGVMPLIQDDWSEGKGGYKMLQYMSAGIPSVVSPIGINATLLSEAKCGIEARQPGDWSKALQALWSSYELREALSLNGYKWLNNARTVLHLQPLQHIIEEITANGSTNN